MFLIRFRPAIAEKPSEGACDGPVVAKTRAGGGKSDDSLPIIRLEGVSKMFKGDADEDTLALDDVTVDINRGEYVSVSGPSGCGKSTFLSVLALLETPTSGRYWLNGRRTDHSRRPSAPGSAASTSG